MGRRRADLPGGPEGVLIVDKPAGMTSHDVVARIRRLAGIHRVGHTGTLDPAATGVLVVCLGRATRLVTVLQAGEKTYAATVQLGIVTDSDDLDGAVLATSSAAGIDERTVCGALAEFHGELDQIPPMVSALRIDGERLHEKARRGEVVERRPRRVRVQSIVLDHFEPGERASVSFLVACSAGTYVRSIARDLGERLGVGGTLAVLRRVANGPFTLEDAVTLDALESDPGLLAQRLLTPLAALQRVMPVVEVPEAQARRRIATGSDPVRAGLEAPQATSAYVAGELLLGVFGPDGQRLVWADPEQVA
jgi:tRNA pseudouridine55 synthase